jgi:FixJ family two-component response regulator
MDAVSHRTVFILDDDHSICDSLQLLFETAGFATFIFSSSEELLRHRDALRFGCLLLDICIPDQDGIQLLTRLRACGIGLPVVFMTGEPGAASKARAIGDSVIVLEKPMSEQALLASIATALAGSSES